MQRLIAAFDFALAMQHMLQRPAPYIAAGISILGVAFVAILILRDRPAWVEDEPDDWGERRPTITSRVYNDFNLN